MSTCSPRVPGWPGTNDERTRRVAIVHRRLPPARDRQFQPSRLPVSRSSTPTGSSSRRGGLRGSPLPTSSAPRPPLIRRRSRANARTVQQPRAENVAGPHGRGAAPTSSMWSPWGTWLRSCRSLAAERGSLNRRWPTARRQAGRAVPRAPRICERLALRPIAAKAAVIIQAVAGVG